MRVALSALTIPEGIQRFLVRANRGELEVRLHGTLAGILAFCEGRGADKR